MVRRKPGWIGWMVAVGLLLGAPVFAQQQDPYERGDRYEEGDDGNRFGLALGAGLTESGPGTSPYLMAALRIRLGDEGSAEGITAYIEPEVGYWEDDEDRNGFRNDQSDLLLGVNIVGAVEMARVEYFLGAGLGVHFQDTEIAGIAEDDEALGVNVHFGVDVDVTESVGLFGVGRFDLVDDDRDNEAEGKAYLGVRFRF